MFSLVVTSFQSFNAEKHSWFLFYMTLTFLKNPNPYSHKMSWKLFFWLFPAVWAGIPPGQWHHFCVSRYWHAQCDHLLPSVVKCCPPPPPRGRCRLLRIREKVVGSGVRPGSEWLQILILHHIAPLFLKALFLTVWERPIPWKYHTFYTCFPITY